ncbi:MAG: hypothetical protein C0592_01310 [Marinilabiliales bacterium]|nr:MAG: hypothetical protein C0592_01310 [Marinilabiliales bacterium]
MMNSSVDTEQVNLMNRLGIEYMSSDPSVAESIFNKSLVYSDSLQFKHGKADARMYLAEIEIRRGNYSRAVFYLNESMVLYNELNDKNGLGLCLNYMATVHNRQGNFDVALSYASHSLQVFRELDDLEGMAKAYNLIGVIYDNMKEFDKAILNYQKVLEIYSTTNNQEGLGRVYINLAIVYGRIGRTEEAIRLLEKSIKIGEDENVPFLMAAGYGNLAVIYSHQEDYQKALEYHLLSYDIKKQSGDPHSLVISEINIAYNYFYLKQNANALQYILRAIKTGHEIGLKLEMIEAYDLLSKIYEQQGDFRSAFMAKKEQVLYMDSLYGEKQQQRIAEAQQEIERQQLEAENKVLRQQNTIESLQNENEKFLRTFLIIGLAFALLMIFLLWFQVYDRRKKNRTLGELNSQMSNVNKQLKKSELSLKESNFAKDQFFSIISHDLRNPLASMVSFVRILKRDYDVLSEVERNSLIDEFSSVVGRTSDLLENLLLWSRSQTGKLAFKPTSVRAEALVQENMRIVESNAKSKGIDLKFVCEGEDMWVYADINMMNTVMRNLLSNAVKFTLRNGVVQVGFYRGEDECSFFVKDSGIGIEPSKISQLFNLGQQHVRAGTDNEKGSGLGLILCKEFVEKNNGRIWVESVAGEGATFYFTLPAFTDSSLEDS